MIDLQHKRAVTLQDIADRCGLNKTTVSRALRGNRARVSEDTIARVQQMAAELGYDPSRAFAARHLALQRFGQRPLARTIAAYFPRQFSTETYWVRTYLGMLDECAAAGFGVLTLYADDVTAALPHPALAAGYVDGVVAMSTAPSLVQTLEAAERLLHTDLPLITLIYATQRYPAIVPDDRQGGFLAADHLLGLGHRHLLHCYHQHELIDAQRLAGIREAYRAHGLDPADCLHAYPDWNEYLFDAGGHPEQLLVTLRAALARWPQTTAVLAPNDYWAARLARALGELGLRIPDQISLVGFDDTENYGIPDAAGQNTLTTVAIPLEEIGRQGARLLLARIQGHEMPIPAPLPTRLVVRTSTAAPRA